MAFDTPAKPLSQLTLGVIGLGNLGSALVQGLLESRLMTPKQIWGGVASEDTRQRRQRQLGIPVEVAPNYLQYLAQTDVLVLGTKPASVLKVAGLLNHQDLRAHTIVVSLAAGVSIEQIERALLPHSNAVIRAMPNTPCMVRSGLVALANGSKVLEQQTALIKQVFAPLGWVFVEDESKFDALTALVGSGPAFVLMLMEALSDGAVQTGLPRALANALVPRLLEGTAKMVRETGKHPALLKEEIVTPAGTTIAGLAAMEEHAVRHALMEALAAATFRAGQLKG
jgi:pyrroline-5-carboxylate reductase